MSAIDAGTICKVMERAGISLPDGAYVKHTKMRCCFPDAHRNGDQHPSAWVDGTKNLYGCSGCNLTLTAKDMAGRLNVSWPLGNGGPPVPRPAPTVQVVREGAKVGITGAKSAPTDHPAIRFLESRGIELATNDADPLALIWPADGAGLPEPYAELARRGYCLAVRLYDARSGALASMQARFTGDGEVPDGKKVLFPPGADQARGKVFANLPAVQMMRQSAPNHPRRVVVGEGLTDFLALSLACPDVPVVAVPGASVVAGTFGGTAPRWLRPGMEVISALDGDEPGEVGAQALAAACRSAGAIVRRVRYREGQKDACDIVRAGGMDALKAAIAAAEFPASIRQFGLSGRPLQEYRMTRIATPGSIIGRGLLRPRQFGMIFGGPGFGKTFLALDLALAVASGRDWLGIPVKRARVGYLSLELERWDLTARLDSIMSARGLADDDIGDHFHLISPPDWDENFDLLDPDHAIALQVWIQENGLEFCIVDTLTKAHSGDEKDMRPIANIALSIVRRTDSAIMFVHHPRKPGQQQPGQAPAPTMYEARGDSRWLGEAKLIISLEPRRKVIQMTVTKTNTGAPVAPIYLAPDGNGVLQLTDLPQTRQEIAAGNREAVVNVLESSDDSMTRAEIVRATGIGEDQVKRALTVLVKDGAIISEGSTRDRKYSIRAVESAPDSVRPKQDSIDFNGDSDNEPV